MKKIIIVTKSGYVGNYKDLVEDGRSKEDITSDISRLMQSSKINILYTSESIVFIRPSDISLIEVKDVIPECSCKDNNIDPSFEEEILTDIQEEKKDE